MDGFELPLIKAWRRYLIDGIRAEIRRRFPDVESVEEGLGLGEIVCITAGGPINGKLYDRDGDGKFVHVTIAGREGFIFPNPYLATDHFDSE